MQQTERLLLLQAGSAAPNSRGRVPVLLNSLGDENRIAFSVSFDPTALRDPRIELESPYAEAFLETDTSQLVNGRLGIRLILPDGASFEAGVRTLFRINFAIAEGASAGPQPIEMTDAPVTRGIRDEDGEPLPARYGAGSMSIVPGIEADVAPQPPEGGTGGEDGEIQEEDVERIGQFVVAAAIPEIGAEFQRADCAPLAVKGDGRLSVADWVQAARFMTGMDEPAVAGGPSASADFNPESPAACDAGDGPRALRVAETLFSRGEENVLEIELESAGDENAIGFTLSFDPTLLQYERAALAPAAEGATLLINADRAAQGLLGIALAMPAGQSFPSGESTILHLCFIVPQTGSVNQTVVSLEDSLAVRQMAGVPANALCAEYLPGIVSFTPEVNVPPSLTSLDPPVLFARGSVLSVLLNGDGFVAASIAQVNSSERATEYISSIQLRMTLLPEDIAGDGSVSVTVMNPGEGGGLSNALSLFIVQRAPGDNPRPLLFGLTPSAVAVGRLPFTLKLSGSGFARDSVVRINGQDRKTRFVNESQLEATVTAADLGAVEEIPVLVFNPAPGGGASTELRLSVKKPNPFPRITDLSLEENASGGFTLSINGSNFVRDAAVRVNGSGRSATFVSSSKFTVGLSLQDLAAAAGTLIVVVVNPPFGGGKSMPVSLAITGVPFPANRAPSLFSIAPNSVSVGSAGFTLRVNGSGFLLGSVVQLNGRALATAFINSSQLTATIIASDLTRAANLEVRVVNPDSGGERSLPVTLAVRTRNPDPRITTAALAPESTGGSPQLVVSGSNFLPVSVGRVNGNSRSTTFVNATTLRMALSSQDLSVAGILNITVFTPAPGGGASNTFEFTVNDPIIPVTSSPPSVSDIRPRITGTGAPAFPLLVNGSNFRAGSVIRVNNKPRQTQFVSARQLKTVILATEIGASGAIPIDVITRDAAGGNSNSVTLTVKRRNPAPQLAGISPDLVNAGGRDFQMQVIGANFVNGSVVKVNGSARPTSFVNSGELSATIFAGDFTTPGKTINISVSTDQPGGGTTAQIGLNVTVPVNPQPSISAITPNPVAEGSASFKLTITGQRFISGSVVRVDNVARPTTVLSGTRLTAIIPASDVSRTRNLTIQVFNPEPGGGLSNSASLIVKKRNPVPRITGLSPETVNAGEPGFTLTINGSNFFRDSSVRVKGVNRSFSFVNGSQLTIQISSQEIANPGLLNILVFNPSPGGGNSNAATINIQ
ncbi:MAG: IPT/TIG domain-containing protein [Blastocatellia bacterium]